MFVVCGFWFLAYPAAAVFHKFLVFLSPSIFTFMFAVVFENDFWLPLTLSSLLAKRVRRRWTRNFVVRVGSCDDSDFHLLYLHSLDGWSVGMENRSERKKVAKIWITFIFGCTETSNGICNQINWFIFAGESKTCIIYILCTRRNGPHCLRSHIIRIPTYALIGGTVCECHWCAKCGQIICRNVGIRMSNKRRKRHARKIKPHYTGGMLSTRREYIYISSSFLFLFPSSWYFVSESIWK